MYTRDMVTRHTELTAEEIAVWDREVELYQEAVTSHQGAYYAIADGRLFCAGDPESVARLLREQRFDLASILIHSVPPPPPHRV